MEYPFPNEQAFDQFCLRVVKAETFDMLDPKDQSNIRLAFIQTNNLFSKAGPKFRDQNFSFFDPKDIPELLKRLITSNQITYKQAQRE